MDCDRADSRLVDYLYEELDDPARQEMEAHLATCPACSEKLARLREARAGIAGLEDVEPPAALVAGVLARARSQTGKGKVVPFPLWKTRTRSALALAATAVIGIAVVIGVRVAPPAPKQSASGPRLDGAAPTPGSPIQRLAVSSGGKRKEAIAPEQAASGAKTSAESAESDLEKARPRQAWSEGEREEAARAPRPAAAANEKGASGPADRLAQFAGRAKDEDKQEAVGNGRMLYQIDREVAPAPAKVATPPPLGFAEEAIPPTSKAPAPAAGLEGGAGSRESNEPAFLAHAAAPGAPATLDAGKAAPSVAASDSRAPAESAPVAAPMPSAGGAGMSRDMRSLKLQAAGEKENAEKKDLSDLAEGQPRNAEQRVSGMTDEKQGLRGAVDLAARGDCGRALSILDGIAKQDPAAAETPDFLKARARCLASKGETVLAIQTYERFQALFPRRAGEVDGVLAALRADSSGAPIGRGAIEAPSAPAAK